MTDQLSLFDPAEFVAVAAEAAEAAPDGKLMEVDWETLERVCLAVRRQGPATDWFHTQTVISALEVRGERWAAYVLGAVPPDRRGHVKDLCYVMFSICEKRRMAKEARAYASVVEAWPEMISLMPESLR